MVLTYHCDLHMPAGWPPSLQEVQAHFANRISAHCGCNCSHTRDFAEQSPFLKRFLDKLTVIPPPIICEPVSAEQINAFQDKFDINPERRIIGMVARLASEKGVEYLVQAMPAVLQAHPDAQVIFVGEYQRVIGEHAYREKLLPLIDALGEHWTFLGVVRKKKLLLLCLRRTGSAQHQQHRIFRDGAG